MDSCASSDQAKPYTVDDFSAESHVVLMSVYLSEWVHRDDTLMAEQVRYFYATLIIIFLPNLAAKVGIELPNFPLTVFPIVGLVMAVGFLYVSIGYSLRLRAIGDTYQNLINSLPTSLKRVSLDDLSNQEIKWFKNCKKPFRFKAKYRKIFEPPMSIVISFIMFGGLCVLAVVMLCYNLHISS